MCKEQQQFDWGDKRKKNVKVIIEPMKKGERSQKYHVQEMIDIDPPKEVDPDNIPQHEAGAKLDAGKLKLGNMMKGFSQALRAVCRVYQHGATKYTNEGWKSVLGASCRYTDALLRHTLKVLDGEIMDPSSGWSHKAHIAWNALAILQIEEEEKCPKQSVSTQRPQDSTLEKGSSPSIYPHAITGELPKAGDLKSIPRPDSPSYDPPI